MGNRLSKIYTRTGDKGETGLGDGSRCGKDSARVCAYGTVDELNSLIGLLISETTEATQTRLNIYLAAIQHRLFDLGAELAVPGHQVLGAHDTLWLEQLLDHYNAHLPPLAEFILPGGGRAASVCHLARTVCRRAERDLVLLSRTSTLPEHSLSYLNRLSDLLFVLGRVYARTQSQGEVLWQRQNTLPEIK